MSGDRPAQAGRDVGRVAIEELLTAVVRLHGHDYLPPPHRCYLYTRCRTPRPDFELVDKATGDLQLLAGHRYVVRFNDEPANPRIVEMLEELEATGERGEEESDAKPAG